MSARIRWILVAGAAAIAVAAWWPRGQAPQPMHAAVPAAPAVPPPVAGPVRAAAEPASAPMPTCPHQAMDVTRAGAVERACVAATRTRQSGSVRTYLLEPEGLSAWRLAVEVASGQVLSARLTRPAAGPEPALDHVCEHAACAGLRLGRPDAQGVRHLTLDGVALQALPPGTRWRRSLPPSAGAAADTPARRAAGEVVRLSALFTLPPDSQNPRLACNTASLRWVEPDGALTDFCPMGGAGFELGDAGRARFVFRSLDGQSVAVTLSPDGSVEQVALGAWSCRAPACGGVSVHVLGDASDPLVERRFAFSGTTLFEAGSLRAGAVFNGSLVVPAQ